MFSEVVRINGTLVQAWLICERQVWYLAHSMTADQKNEYLAFGRLIDQNSYAREKHQVNFGDSKFDFVQGEEGQLVVSEIKKSSRTEKASRLQLAHYLYSLKKEGIEARGLLLFPTEKKRVEVDLTRNLMDELETIYSAIETLTSQTVPPSLVRCKYCDKCAYGEYCWG